MGPRWITQLAWWWIQRQKPIEYGVWMPVPDGYEVIPVEKRARAGTADPLEAYRTVGIKLRPIQR